MAMFLKPWSPATKYGAQSKFWFVGASFFEGKFHFDVRQLQERDIAAEDIGFRCALDWEAALQRLSETVESPEHLRPVE